jgi:hypothetical protein
MTCEMAKNSTISYGEKQPAGAPNSWCEAGHAGIDHNKKGTPLQGVPSFDGVARSRVPGVDENWV